MPASSQNKLKQTTYHQRYPMEPSWQFSGELWCDSQIIDLWRSWNEPCNSNSTFQQKANVFGRGLCLKCTAGMLCSLICMRRSSQRNLSNCAAWKSDRDAMLATPSKFHMWCIFDEWRVVFHRECPKKGNRIDSGKYWRRCVAGIDIWTSGH